MYFSGVQQPVFNAAAQNGAYEKAAKENAASVQEAQPQTESVQTQQVDATAAKENTEIEEEPQPQTEKVQTEQVAATAAKEDTEIEEEPQPHTESVQTEQVEATAAKENTEIEEEPKPQTEKVQTEQNAATENTEIEEEPKAQTESVQTEQGVQVLVHNLEEYLAAIESCFERLNEGGEGQLWFRGVKSQDYTLLPAIARGELNVSVERAFISSFKSNILPYLSIPFGMPISFSSASYWEMLFLMQYYGVPTRIMDWTQDALAALFFAVEGFDDREKSENPAVWCLNPKKLNQASALNEYFSDGFIPDADEPIVFQLFGTQESKTDKKPCAVYEPLNSARVIAQKDVFTIFPFDTELCALDSFSDSKDYLLKITVDAESRGSLTEQLGHCGIKKPLIMPELQAAVNQIKAQIMRI
jgi:hypothetical protein